MNINLPDIDIQEGWTQASQLKKLFEEAGEVAEAVAQGDPVNTIREAMDTMQTAKTLITMVAAEFNLNMARFEVEHIYKLHKKGYMKEATND